MLFKKNRLNGLLTRNVNIYKNFFRLIRKITNVNITT